MHLSQYFGESDLSRDLLPKAYGSDVLRAALGSLGAAPSIVLMNKLRAVCGPILELPEVEGDLDRERAANKFYQAVLRTSLRLGDIALHPSDDYPRYVPAPLKLVYLGATSKAALIIGGSSNTSVSKALGAPVKTFGFARYIDRRELRPGVRTDDSLWQNAQDWLGCSARSLKGFTDTMMDQDVDRWIDGAPLGCAEVEVFCPGQSNRRWFRLDSLRERPSGIRLCRATLDAAQYRRATKLKFLATLTNSADDAAIVSQNIMLTPNDGDRLAFGLESRESCSIRIPAVLSKNVLEIALHRLLPTPERKLFDLGVRVVDDDGERLAFPKDLQPLVELVLNMLDVSLSLADANHG
jgi:hypothetical protein